MIRCLVVRSVVSARPVRLCGLISLLLASVCLRGALPAEPAEELWSVQGSASPFADPIAPPKGFVDQSAPPSAPPDELKSRAAGMPFVVFAPHPFEPPLPGHCPQPWEVTNTVGAFASLDEYEPLTFAVYALADVQNLRVEVESFHLRGQPTESIPLAEMELRAVRCLNRYMGEKKFSRSPILLEKVVPCDVPAGSVKQFWLTVHVSERTTPGLYDGRARLILGDRKSVVTLNLRVLPIKLLRAPTAAGFWYDMAPDWKGFYANNRDACLRMMYKHFTQMREYGLNSLAVCGVPASRTKSGKTSPDFTHDARHEKDSCYGLSDLFSAGKKTGLLARGAPILYSGADALRTVAGAAAQGTDTSAYAQAARALAAEAKAQGWPPFVFVPVNELDKREGLRDVAGRFLGALKQCDLTTGATLNGLWFGQDAADSDALRGLIDVRIYSFVNAAALDSARRAEKSLWIYDAGVSPWEPKRARLAFGLYTARCGATGCFQRAYMWPAKPGVGPYHELGAGAQFHGQSFAYPAPDGPLPTLALEAVREGLDDLRYIHTLNQAIADARKASRADAADAAQAALDAVLANVPVETDKMNLYADRLPCSAADMARWKMALSAISLRE